MAGYAALSGMGMILRLLNPVTDGAVPTGSRRPVSNLPR
jgi:hypothetical protein